MQRALAVIAVSVAALNVCVPKGNVVRNLLDQTGRIARDTAEESGRQVRQIAGNGTRQIERKLTEIQQASRGKHVQDLVSPVQGALWIAARIVERGALDQTHQERNLVRL